MAPDSETAPLSFPRLSARTQRFTLGEPRSVTVAGDGSRVLFVRTGSATDRTGALWEFDVAGGTERLLADPGQLLGGAEDLSPAERARRERARESGAGVTGYSTDDSGRTVVFALSGGIWVCDADGAREVDRGVDAGAAIDPRVDPTGRRVAYACGQQLRLVGLGGTADAEPDRPLVGPEPGEADTVSWGQAEFVAAEEMDRYRGFWWAPDGRSLLVQRTDVAPIPLWHIADPADPAAAPVAHRYPVAGSADAEVSLWHVALSGERWHIPWDATDFPYLCRVSWTSGGAVIQVLSRDQRRGQIIRIDVTARTVTTLADLSDDTWIELVPGVPVLAADGRLVSSVDDQVTDTRRVAVDGRPVSPPGVQIRSVEGTDDSGILVRCSAQDPTSVQLARVSWTGDLQPLSPESGVHSGMSASGTTALISTDLDSDGTTVTVLRSGEPVGTLQRRGASPDFVPQVAMLRSGGQQIATAVLFPRDRGGSAERLPVLLAPYGGPHGQLVMRSRRMFLQAQYLADQGFCVIVADGRGTPGRGPAWEKAVRDRFAEVTLADQVAALQAVAERYPDDVDTSRVGILGWSYGGYLSALAVLARPDLFRAAVAGAPVTDWRLYDTFYTERYLGHPATAGEVYERNSLLSLASAPLPAGAAEPDLLILHGMVDDNVVVAHTMQLSSALLAAGRRHSVLPLTGVTHMTPQEVVAENLLTLQVDFLRRSLAG